MPVKKTTYRSAQKFDAIATQYLIRNGFFDPEKREWTKKDGTKLSENLKSVLKQWNNHLETYQEEIAAINRNNALVDEKTKALLREEVTIIGKDGGTQKSNSGNYKYSAEGEAKREKEIKELNKTEISFNARITDIFSDLTDDEYEFFQGFVIPEVPVPSEPVDGMAY